MQVQYLTKFRIHLQFAESHYISGFRLQFAESTFSLVAESATLQMCRQKLRYTHMYAESTEVSGNHLHFGTCLKISFWNPGTNRHKIVRLSSAQIGLVLSLTTS